MGIAEPEQTGNHAKKSATAAAAPSPHAAGAAAVQTRGTSNHLVERYLWFVVGVAINSFAIALIAKANLGVGAISCVAFVLAEASGLSFGAFTFVVNMLFIVAQIALLRRDFKPV